MNGDCGQWGEGSAFNRDQEKDPYSQVEDLSLELFCYMFRGGERRMLEECALRSSLKETSSDHPAQLPI